jgi:hypothetical protein
MPRKNKRGARPNAEYVIPPCTLQSDTVRVLAFDPGSRNMGISCVATAKGRVKVVANSIVTNPVNDLTVFGSRRDLFLEEMDRWITEFQPRGIVAERFQTRGIGGPLIEQVSSMLGLLAGRYHTLPVKLITAATWKNAFHRRFDTVTLDDLYRESLTTPHQLDSCFIGIYGLEAGLGTELKFDPRTIVSQAEDTSLVRLINKRR